MSNYTAALPPSSSPSSTLTSIQRFYSSFYRTSDNPSPQSHTEYTTFFTPTATLTMGLNSSTGTDQILTFRKSLWSGPVVKRKHTVHKIFPWNTTGDGVGKQEVMLYGDVEYGLKNGKEVTVEWAGRAVLVPSRGGKEDGREWEMESYQVYLDSGAVVAAAAASAGEK